MTGMALQVVRTDGFLALYNGLSASLCRQMTYSLTRFAIYETMRDYMAKDNKGPLPFYNKVLLGGISGEHWVVRARAGQRPRTRAIRP